MILRNRRLMQSPTNNTHKYSIENSCIYAVYCASHDFMKVLVFSVVTEQTRQTETKYCLLIPNLLHILYSCSESRLNTSRCFTNPKLHNEKNSNPASTNVIHTRIGKVCCRFVGWRCISGRLGRVCFCLRMRGEGRHLLSLLRDEKP
jgi:hypothetical protein